MVDFVLLPPEVNSARIFAGTDSRSLLVAAAAWDGLAAQLDSARVSFESMVSTMLAQESLYGAPAALITTWAAAHAQWLAMTASSAEQAALNARKAVAAYEAARAATVHPTVVAANRTLFATLVANNVLEHNTANIAAAEAQYAEIWAIDVTAMINYHKAVALLTSALKPFSAAPPQVHPRKPGLEAPFSDSTASGGAGRDTLASSLPMMLAPTEVERGASAGTRLISPLTASGQTTSGAGPARPTRRRPAAGSMGTIRLLGPVSAVLGQGSKVGSMSVPASWASATAPTGGGDSGDRHLSTPSRTALSHTSVGPPSGPS